MAGIRGAAAWVPPELYKREVYDKFEQYLEGRIADCPGEVMARYGTISASRRGFCNIVAEDFFEWLEAGNSLVKVTEVCVKKGTDTVCMLLDRQNNIYFKRVCFCQIEKCSDIERLAACVATNNGGIVKSCGHFAIILSDTDSLKTSVNDYILDFTYEQMLHDEGAAANAGPPYYIARLGEVFTKRRTPRWETQYRCPSKHIISTRRTALAGGRRTRSRRTRSRRMTRRVGRRRRCYR
jgi:hypothetical protein